MLSLINKALPLLSRAMPAGLALRGLQSLSPQMKKFVDQAFTAGYSADLITDFVRDKMRAEGDKMEEGRLEGQTSLTPQEKTALAKRKSENKMGSVIGAGVGLATGLAGLRSGGEPTQKAIRGEIMPPLPQGPQGLPAPDQQKQIQGQQQLGLPSPAQVPPEPLEGNPPKVQPNQNPVQKISKGLNEFIREKINSGATLEEAGEAALMQPHLQRAIAKLEYDSGESFISVLQKLFGSGASAQRRPQQQGQSQGGGQEKLMAILAQLQQTRGNRQ